MVRSNGIILILSCRVVVKLDQFQEYRLNLDLSKIKMSYLY